MNNEKRLPIFGIGPTYFLITFFTTVLFIFLSKINFVPVYIIESFNLKLLGIFLMVIGISLWVSSVLFSKLVKSIKNGRLLTTGVYAYVRNPIYSAFLFLFTGIIIYFGNVILFILPMLYWMLLTIMLKKTEEKWLYEAFGEEYIDYCNKVNRCVPWLRRGL